MARSLTSSLTALNAPAKQAQMTRISSSDEAASLVAGSAVGAARPGTVACGDGCAVACPGADAGADAGAGAGAGAGAEVGVGAVGDADVDVDVVAVAVVGADAVAVVGADAVADARAAGCAASACGDGWAVACLRWVACPEGLLVA